MTSFAGEIAELEYVPRLFGDEAACPATQLHPEPRSMGTQIYARIKRTSKYFYQNPPGDEPFPVDFDSASDSHTRWISRGSSYIAAGNGNQYCLSDLRLFIRQGNQFVKIS